MSLTFGSPFALGDFKGNGEPDLAYTTMTNPTSSSLNIVLDITGGPPSVVSTPLNCGAGVPVLGDVNNDGKLDVVLSCTNYVVVLLGNGDGTFLPPAYYAVNTLSAPTLVDLNGDHYFDIVVFSSATSGYQATVFLNDGSSSPGVFGAPANYSAGTAQAAPAGEFLAGGDFNGDGKQDVIASALNGFVLFFGNGDGTLQPASVQSVIPKNFPLSFTVGDFNQNGITDVAVLSSSTASYSSTTNPSYSDIQILLGSSSGNLTQGATLPAVGNGSNSVEISTAALTSGGNLDLIVGGDYTTIFQGDGKGNFTQPISYAAFGTPFVFDVNGNGKPDLLLFDGAELSILTANGDGTFQGLRTTPVNATGNSSIVSADFNNDGVADVAFVPPQGSCGQAGISVDLGRGDGTFAPLDQSVATSGTTCDGVALIPGDFNQDGKTDLVAIAQGHGYEVGGVGPTDAQLFFYAGKGNGTFQPAGPALDLGATYADAIIGDFNGDGKLDLIVNFSQDPTAPTTGSGLLFLPGNGDGTFGTPVQFAQINPGSLFAADLNHDGKLDLVGGAANGGTIFLGNGDGTFQQTPLNVTFNGYLAAVADMNGDGYPDLITCGDGTSVYTGNGDGTFQTSPLYTSAVPQNYSCKSAAAGDVDGNGNPDLVTYSYNFTNTEGPAQLSVSYGDGHGAFTADPNTYFTGVGQSSGSLLLTRLNDNAPPLSSDQALDALVISYSDLTGLLNQKNPAPSTPAVFNSSMTLQSSVASANENASITLTAAVLGTNPTGNVAFSSSGTSLGTATLANGTATLQTSFANAGTYAVTASYQGDGNNSASTSNTVSITVAAPDYTVTSSPMSASITAGQAATFTLTVTPQGGYAGTVNFSCGSLPSEATCTFSPSAVTPANGSATTSTLTISTTGTVAALRTPPAGNHLPWIPAGSLALAGAVGLLVSPKRLTQWNRRLWMLASAMLLSCAWFSLTGCSGNAGNTSNPPKNPGTPSGAYTVNVNLSDGSGGPTHTLALKVTIQ